jgi:hypothetical protein
MQHWDMFIFVILCIAWWWIRAHEFKRERDSPAPVIAALSQSSLQRTPVDVLFPYLKWAPLLYLTPIPKASRLTLTLPNFSLLVNFFWQTVTWVELGSPCY